MAYNGKRDFITIDGMDFTNILDEENAFTYSRNGDTMEFRKDSGGSDIAFILVDDSITGSITIRPDAGTALRKLRQLMNTNKKFSMSRDNRNSGGEAVKFLNCYIINDGENGKGSRGVREGRTFNFRCDKSITDEGAY